MKVFQSVCREMNMTKASNELFISQPAISKTISEIEHYYHIKLFERRNKALFLLQDGERLLEYANQILNLMEQMDADMRESNHLEVIRVGASITVGTSILNDIVYSYQKENPNVKIVATVDNTDVIERDLRENKLDIAIVEGDIKSAFITTEPLGDTEIVLVVNRMHPLYDKQTVCLQDLNNMDFIVREEGSKTRACFSDAMSLAGIRWNATWSCHNTQAIKNAVDVGLGIGVLSKLSVRRRLHTGRFRALDVFSEPLMIHQNIAYAKNKHFPGLLIDFKSFLLYKYRTDLSGTYKERPQPY